MHSVANVCGLNEETSIHTQAQSHAGDKQWFCVRETNQVENDTEIYRVAPKGSHKVLSISLSNIDRLSIFFTGAFCGKFVIKWLFCNIVIKFVIKFVIKWLLKYHHTSTLSLHYLVKYKNM